MPPMRVQISGIASLDEARLAVAAGADAIGLDLADFASPDLGGNELMAAIALALPPTITPVLITSALTAGTIAQQVDAAAALVVQLARPLLPSEFPGLKRIIRGRKIIQSITVEGPQPAVNSAYAEFADALHLVAMQESDLPHCRSIAEAIGIPVFLRLERPYRLGSFRPFGIDLAKPTGAQGFDARAVGAFLETLA